MASRSGGGSSGPEAAARGQFVTREGAYRLLPPAEYSRANHRPAALAQAYSQGHQQQQQQAQQQQQQHGARISLVTVPRTAGDDDGDGEFRERLAFNCGKELYVYAYRSGGGGGALDDGDAAAAAARPLDKKIYKGTCPTCHDFNAATASRRSLELLVGFSTGQLQVLDAVEKDAGRLYNEERHVDKTRVTCVRWAPDAGGRRFVAAHASGGLYVYDDAPGAEAPTGAPAPPHYQPLKRGDGFAIHAVKGKAAARNPVARWRVGGADGAPPRVNEFAFSPSGRHLAVASQDGFLSVFDWAKTELVGRARSYFGGFLCVCWSPDGEYVAVGGEDDLVTVWSFGERRVVARGQGHRSWVSAVAFDPFNCISTSPSCYRLGSVSQDTQLCLWDVTEDALRPPKGRASTRASASNGAPPDDAPPPTSDPPVPPPAASVPASEPPGALGAVTQRLAGLAFGDRRDRATSQAKGGREKDRDDPGRHHDSLRLIGTAACPRFEECPVLEPLVCKKIAHERLTALAFREDRLLTACQDGGVYTWARPGPPPPPGADAPPPDAARLFERDRRFDRVDSVD